MKFFKLIFFLVLISLAGYTIYLFKNDRNKVRSLDVTVSSLYYNLTGNTAGVDCFNYYEAEEVYDFSVYVHTREIVCNRDILILDPSMTVQTGNNFGRMKFFVSDMSPNSLNLVHFQNEEFNNNFRTGNFIDATGASYTVGKNDVCFPVNRYVPQDDVLYCFRYNNNNLIMSVKAPN